MIITPQKLIDLAVEHVERARADPDLIAAYLIGSVLSGEPLLGGAADIDLVLVHRQTPALPREFLVLSRDVHLDVAHHAMDRYSQPRRLRFDPWLGPSVREARVLYDPVHFFDLAVAGARGQFLRADAVTARAEALLSASRDNAASAAQGEPWRAAYLRALVQACNAAAMLVAHPACGRRTSITLENHFTRLGDPTFFEAYLSLHGATALTDQDVAQAISSWARAADADAGASPPRLLPVRVAYWLRGFRALAEAGRPDAAVWPLLFTWETLVNLPAGAPRDPGIESDLAPILARASLDDPQRADRLLALDAFTDRVEDLVQAWARRHGA